MSPSSRKNKKDNWLPPRVYRGKYKYEWHPKSGGSKVLCPLDATEAQVWTAYREALGQGVRDVEWLTNKYLSSKQFLRLKPNTQCGYNECWKKLKPVFAHVTAKKIRPHHIRRYMDERGKKTEVRANKERRFLSNVFGYGFERDWVSLNPCIGVKPFLEEPRDKYITDDEYYSFYEAAEPIVRVFMELSYINAARGQDVRKITLKDINDIGLYIQQKKTGKKQIKLLNDRLRAAVALAHEVRKERLKKNVDCMFLVITRNGTPYSVSGLKSLWRRARESYFNKTQINIDWTYHDIKAKGISDYEGDKRSFSGHKTHSMMERYNRSPDAVEVIDFPAKRQ